MVDTRQIEDLAQRLANATPPGLKQVRRELEENFRAILRARLSRLDLISRDEFDAQRRVLERTRKKLEDLQGRIASLERQLEASGAEASDQP